MTFDFCVSRKHAVKTSPQLIAPGESFAMEFVKICRYKTFRMRIFERTTFLLFLRHILLEIEFKSRVDMGSDSNRYTATAVLPMSGSPTFDTGKKTRNGANLKLSHILRVGGVIIMILFDVKDYRLLYGSISLNPHSEKIYTWQSRFLQVHIKVFCVQKVLIALFVEYPLCFLLCHNLRLHMLKTVLSVSCARFKSHICKVRPPLPHFKTKKSLHLPLPEP